MKIKFWCFRNFWWLIPIALVVVSASLYLFGIELDFKISSALLGSALSLAYFLQKQKLEEAKLFREIFEECNRRYNEMNASLNAIIIDSNCTDLTTEEINLLNDYFNLCGEEYLYYRQGYIYPSVWEAWLNGMKYIFKNEKIKRHWENEKLSGSFYDLPL